MKIAIWHNLPSGGGKRALQYQVRGLVSRGHYIKIWTAPTSCQPFADLRPYAEEVVVPLPDLRTRRGLRYKGRLASVAMLDKINSMREHCRSCAAQIHAEGFDVLMAHPCVLFRSSPIGEFCELPKLMYLQEPFRALYEALPELPWLAPELEIPQFWPPRALRKMLREWDFNYAVRLQARAEVLWMRRFDSIGVNSLFSRESLLRAYGLESRVLYLGVDTDTFIPSGTGKQPYVVGLGSATLAKGIDRAVDAIATIPAPIRPPLIWIGNVGSPDFERDMHQRAKAGGVNLSIRVMVEDAEMIRILSDAACIIYPPRLEPFGFAPLEACACGTPAVAIAEGGVRETIVDGQHGILIPFFDPIALGKAIASFTGDLDRAAQVGRAARENVVANWKWEKSCAELEDALEKTIRARSQKLDLQ